MQRNVTHSLNAMMSPNVFNESRALAEYKYTVTNRKHHKGFYRASICEGGLWSRNSVCPSVCLSHAWIVTKLNDAKQIFLYHTKGQSLCYSDIKSDWWVTPPSV